jgi:tetratricopeptide (TPR) repeat protein
MPNPELLMKSALLHIFLITGLFLKAQSPLAEVRSSLQSGDFKTSQQILDSCSKINFQPDSVLFYKGLLSLKKDNVNAARKYCTELEKTYPTFKEAHYLSGLIYFLNEKYGKSIDEFNKILKDDPRHLKALYNRALAAGLIEDYRSAIEDLGSCIALDPNYSLAYYSRAYWEEYTGNDADAKKDYEVCIRLDPKNFDAYFGLAYVYKNLKEHDKACETVSKAISAGSQIAEELKENFCR